MLKLPVVLITGASRGLGRAMALLFAQKGYAIGINYHSSESQAQKLKADLDKLSVPSLLLKADVSNASDVNEMVKKIELEWGRLDILINNAGLTRDRSIFKMKDAEWKDVLGVNIDGPFYCTRAALPMMRQQKKGVIINISSYLAKKMNFGAANYAVAKAGLVALTKSTALEEGRYGICVNAVMPGFHVTDMNQDLWKRYAEKIKASHLLTKLPEKEKLAEFIYFIAQFDNISGQEFAFESRLF